MTRRWLWVIVGIAACWSWDVQAFEGRIVSPDGAPLSEVRVGVVGRSGAEITSQDGRFSILPDPRPPFELIVSTAENVILLRSRVAELPPGVPVQLTVEPTLEEKVTVVSGVVPDMDLPPASAATVIGRSDLEQRLPQRLPEVLEVVPGADRLEEGSSMVPSLRGLARSRTLILLDGARVTAERRAGPSATFLDPVSLAEVEVIRGPGSVAYGSEAFGGVIRAASRFPHPGEGTEIRYSLFSGTGGFGNGSSVEFSSALGKGAFLAGVQVRCSPDYTSGAGKISNSGAHGRGARVAFVQPWLGGELRLQYRKDIGRDIGKPASDSNITRAYYPEENSERALVSFDRAGDGVWRRLKVALSWDRYGLVTNRDTFATAATPRILAQADVSSQDFGLRVEAERKLGTGRLRFGMDLNGRFGLRAWDRSFQSDQTGEGDSWVSNLSIDKARRRDDALFATYSHRIGSWDVAGGVRGDRVENRNRGGYFGDREREDSALSGFAALGYAFAPGWSLTVQASRGFRDPLLSDRYFRGPSGRGYVIGNPDLRPEHSRQWDLALRSEQGKVRWAAFAYLYRITDLIERYKKSGNYWFRNRGEGEIRGLELEGEWIPAPGWSVVGGAQTARGEILDDATPLTDIPAAGCFAYLRRQSTSRFWWMIRAAAFRRDERNGPAEIPVPGYGVVDAVVGYKLNRALEIQLGGRNLLNHRYLGTADEKSVDAPGRSIQLTLRGVLQG